MQKAFETRQDMEEGDLTAEYASIYICLHRRSEMYDNLKKLVQGLKSQLTFSYHAFSVTITKNRIPM